MRSNRLVLVTVFTAASTLAGCQAKDASQKAAAAEPSTVQAPQASPVANAGPKVSDTIEVYKSPTCGCCSMWVGQLKDAGFTVVTHDTSDVESVKAAVGVPNTVRSCHTAVVKGYVIEGHVPVAEIVRLVTEKPADVAGIGVDGMPIGSPGMEGMGRKDAFDVQAWGKDGKTRVITSVKGS